MCDQTEIDYLDGDVVWVKLGSYWWPGQVVGLTNLPEQIQRELQNQKSLIAVVKFFQEDNFEYVKNYHQIYKYNCLQKDEFIRKGLDKYRAKLKDGSTFMNKFPTDVEIAEKMTNGNPDILSDKKFSPEEKPDISSIFGGPKKLPKKKRFSEEGRRSVGGDEIRKVMRVSKMEHKLKMRRQLSDLPILPNSAVNTHYPCYVCEFTTTRVNNISYHLQSHKNEAGVIVGFGKSKTPKGKQYVPLTPKRKYVKKDKSATKKSKDEESPESAKRKQKEVEKTNKKKKIDNPAITEIMADWDDHSNDEADQPVEHSESDVMDVSTVENSTATLETTRDETMHDVSEKSLAMESDSILEETEKLLKDTEKLSEIVSPSKNSLSTTSKYSIKSPILKDKVGSGNKSEEKQSEEDKKSRLSCFDFEEDPEPAIPHVRKLPRASGMPLKKEIIKEFEMSQALKNEKEKKALEASSGKQKDTFQDKLSKFSFQHRQESAPAEEPVKESVKDSMQTSPSKNDTETNSSEVMKTALERLGSPTRESSSPVKHDSPKKMASPEKVGSPEKKAFLPKSAEKIESPMSPLKEASPLKKKDSSPEKVKSPEKNAASVVEEKVEILEIVEFEADMDKVNFRKDTEQKTQPVTKLDEENDSVKLFLDQKLMQEESAGGAVENGRTIVESSVKDTSSMNESTLSEEADAEFDAVREKPVEVKVKRRGRPKKVAVPVKEVKEEQPKETKPPEVVSDRSRFSGRIRKRSTKYEYSVDYSSSPARTDDSQSDFEERLFEEKIKKKEKDKKTPSGKRRGRPPKNPQVETEKKKIDLNESALSQSELDKSEVREEQMSIENEMELMFESSQDQESTSASKGPATNYKTDFSDCLSEDKVLSSLEDETQQTVVNNSGKAEQPSVSITPKVQETIDILPPKKSQIKKFEQAQLDALENKLEQQSKVAKGNESPVKSSGSAEINASEPKQQSDVLYMEITQTEQVIARDDVATENNVTAKDPSQEAVNNLLSETENKDSDPASEETAAPQKSPVKIRTSSNFLPGYPYKPKRELIEENAPSSFQDAFLKTMQIEPNEVKKPSETITVLNENDGTIQVINATDSESISISNTQIKETPLSVDTHKLEDSLASTLSPSSDVSVPVKKREKPRIIENVALKEPLILKSQLVDRPLKILKHKMEPEQSGRMKVMKLESPKTTTKKITLVTAAKKVKGQKVEGEKQVVLDDMEMDINNMPFVLSEDILTPENIDKIPVMISSVPIQTSMTSGASSSTSTTPLKKKREAPSILKSKVKGKPTITSIKTIVPPYTTVKGLFSNTKMTTVGNDKNNSVKHVQATNNQPVRYSVQGKLTHAQVGKNLNSAQVIQHGSKVYILSPQSPQDQTKLIGVGKGAKVQRIVSNRSQIYTELSPQGSAASKTLTPIKSDSMPTTSRVVSMQKIIIPGKSSSMLGTVIQANAKSVNPMTSSIAHVSGKPTIIATKPKGILTTQQGAYGKITTSKGTVLTPITGQEIKALVAKSPSKVGQKIPQMSMVQKVKKISIADQTNMGASISSGMTMKYKSPLGMQGRKGKQSSAIVSTVVNSSQLSPVSSAQQKARIIANTQKIVVTKAKPTKVSQENTRVVHSRSMAIESELGEVPTIITKSTIKQKPLTSPKVESVSKPVEQQNLLNQAMSSALGANFGKTTEQSNLDISRESNPDEPMATVDDTKTEATSQKVETSDEMTIVPGQVYAIPTENADGSINYLVFMADEHGNLNAFDNNTVVLDESGESLNNLVLQSTSGNGDVSTIQATETETPQIVSSEITPKGNQDILAAALANTDLQQDLETPMVTLSTPGLMNQSVTPVLETSLTLNQPIMTPMELPTNLPIQSEIMSNVPSATKITPTSLELPITITDPNISYIASGDTQVTLTASSMPEIGDIIDTSTSSIAATKIPQVETTTTEQYIVIPNVEENVVEEQPQAEKESIPLGSYSVSIPEDISTETTQVQTTPSMPIIDDGFVDNFEDNVSETVSQILRSKTDDSVANTVSDVTVSSESEKIVSSETCEVITENVQKEERTDNIDTQVIAEETVESSKCFDSAMEIMQSEVPTKEQVLESTEDQTMKTSETIQEQMQVECEQDVSQATAQTANDYVMSTETKEESRFSEQVPFELMDTSEPLADACQEAEASNKLLNDEIPVAIAEESVAPSNDSTVKEQTETLVLAPAEPTEVDRVEVCTGSENNVDEAESSHVSANNAEAALNLDDTECARPTARPDCELDVNFDEAEASQEAPSQSFERVEEPSQSAKSENSREPTQSFEDVDTPTQSYNEALENRAENSVEAADDPSFPTQSYEVEKSDNLSETLDTDLEISQEGNLPSQSNDEGIGTSSISNNLGLNEDETASSSYVPETPEMQERDQDQESAISTSSYEIPPCEELNIASSSVIPDTSVDSEHLSIHDNGVPEIPTSSYNLNPDSSSTHTDSLPTSSYEDQIIVEQNVSTSYEVAISMPGLEDTSSQNLVSESGNEPNSPSSYYLHQPEVSASYYKQATHENSSDSRLKSSDNPEEVSASYYESRGESSSGGGGEASQSFFAAEEVTASYCGQNLSPGYYDPRADAEASQSFYSRSGQSMQNVEATQSSFYPENSAEQRDGEATPASYSERYQMDYAAADSPIDRHDLVESSSARQR